MRVRQSVEGPDPLGRAAACVTTALALSELAQEIKTPLATISAHAEESLEILDHLRRGQLTVRQQAEVRERLKAIMQQAQRCSRLVTGLQHLAGSKEAERQAGPIGLQLQGARR